MMKKISVLLLCAIVLVAVDASAWSGRSGWNIFSRWTSNQQARDPDFRRFPSGLTFYKDFSTGEGTDVNALNADFSLGSRSATFAASRNATTPATYIDSSGVVQVTTTANVPRFTKGYYDTTGFHSREGVLIEGAATNYFARTDGTASAAGVYTGWIESITVAGTQVSSNVLVPELTSISGAKSQRHQYTAEAGDGAAYLRFQSTYSAVGSIVNTDVVTVSFWARSQTGMTGTTEFSGTIQITTDIAGNLSTSNSGALTLTSEWQRFSWTYTVVDATASRAVCFIGMQNTVDDGDIIDYEFYGLQFEKTPYATTFIPTTTAALTRNKETLKYEIDRNRTAATEAMAAKITPEFASSLTGNKYITATDTKLRIMWFGSGDDIYVRPNNTDSSGSTVNDLINASWTANTEMTLGYNMQSTGDPNVAGFYNGVADGTNDNDDYTANAWGTYFWVGSENSGTSQLNGIIQKIGFWNRVLTASEHASVDGLMD